MSHKQTLQGAHEKGKIEKVRDVHSNALHSREIRRRQAGATIKRSSVKRNGVRARTASVATCVSSCNRDKINIGIARKQRAQRAEKQRAVQAITRVVSARRSAHVYCVVDNNVMSQKQRFLGAHEKG
jgi:hypothetical protein